LRSCAALSTGTHRSKAYVEQRRALQGKEDPLGSGKYPEPKWLGMIQHDMMLFDHGPPRADGTVRSEQRPEADVNIEFQVLSPFAAKSQELAWAFQMANEKYATDYPAFVGSHMTNTDSSSFDCFVAAISLREAERGTQIGLGWDPHWRQPTDVFATFDDKDFRLGLTAAQTTPAAAWQSGCFVGNLNPAQKPANERTKGPVSEGSIGWRPPTQSDCRPSIHGFRRGRLQVFGDVFGYCGFFVRGAPGKPETVEDFASSYRRMGGVNDWHAAGTSRTLQHIHYLALFQRNAHLRKIPNTLRRINSAQE